MSTLDEIHQMAKESREKNEKLVFVDDGHIVIDLNVLCNASTTYDIPLEQCKTAEQILGWVWQLSEKTWLTNDVLRRFVAIATEQAAVDIHQSRS
jgi:hypothetical protein